MRMRHIDERTMHEITLSMVRIDEYSPSVYCVLELS